MRYKAPTIKEQGGLKVYLSSLGVDYAMFKLLRGLPGQNKTSIAKALSVGRDKQISSRTIHHWIRVDDEELKEA